MKTHVKIFLLVAAFLFTAAAPAQEASEDMKKRLEAAKQAGVRKAAEAAVERELVGCPLHIAVFLGDTEGMLEAIGAGSVVDGYCAHGQGKKRHVHRFTPIQAALLPLTNASGDKVWPLANAETIDLLLAAGADVNAREDNTMDGWLDIQAETAMSKLSKPAADYYLGYLGSIDKENYEEPQLSILFEVLEFLETYQGWTPLHYVARFGRNPEVTTALLRGGADVNLKADDGMMPLHRAAKYNENPAIISALIERGNVNAKTTGSSNVQQMMIPGMVFWNDINAKATGHLNDGWTPLDFAIDENNHAALRLIRNAGGRCNKKC